MSVTRRALLGFFAGLPLALRSMASEPTYPRFDVHWEFSRLTWYV